MHWKSPKNHDSTKEPYKYYAGFSPSFVRSALTFINPKANSIVLDPWSGYGTTNLISSELGYASFGIDINPAMVIAGKARCLGPSTKGSLLALTDEIIEHALNGHISEDPNDPLKQWFGYSAVNTIRLLQHSIHTLLIDSDIRPKRQEAYCHVSKFSGLASLFTLALFVTAKRTATGVSSKNPAWVKISQSSKPKIKWTTLHASFRHAIDDLVSQIGNGPKNSELAQFSLGDSKSLPLESGTVDSVITSPPYCTRLDYAKATAIELAVLGVDLRNQTGKDLRRKIMGSTAVRQNGEARGSGEKNECTLKLLNEIKNHPSKGSGNYYYPLFRDYFSDLRASILELERVTKPGAKAVIVVQNSFYKELVVDLQTITQSYFEDQKWLLSDKIDFEVKTSFHYCHVAKAINRPPPTESILCFKKAS